MPVALEEDRQPRAEPADQIVAVELDLNALLGLAIARVRRDDCFRLDGLELPLARGTLRQQRLES